jgi:hypothetical protein
MLKFSQNILLVPVLKSVLIGSKTRPSFLNAKKDLGI